VIACYPGQDDTCAFIGTTAALLTLAAAGASAAGTAYAAHKSASAATDAGNLSAKSAADQLAFAKTQAAQDQANWERTMSFNIDQQNQKASRLQPYVNAGSAAQSSLNNLIWGDNAPPQLSTPAPVAKLPPQAGAASTSPLVTGQPQTSFGNLTDPSAWMGLVGNDQQLASWVKAQNPGLSDELTGYYVKQIKQQPGANPTEQAGSADFWAKKIKADPTTGGAAGAPGAPKTPAPFTNFAAQSQTAPRITLGTLIAPGVTAPQMAAPLTLNSFMRQPAYAQ
jgi:hypothetical protein